jgi:hypothetical protein
MIAKDQKKFILDLEKCELMDSTFMGMLTSVAFLLRDVDQGFLSVVRANARNFSLLESLGLDHLFHVEPEPAAAAPEALKEATCSVTTPEEQKTAILIAHEALVEADPRNAVRFQDVIEFLRQEIADGTPPK